MLSSLATVLEKVRPAQAGDMVTQLSGLVSIVNKLKSSQPADASLPEDLTLQPFLSMVTNQMLRLSQHHFAQLLSFTIAGVSRWELGKGRLSDLSALFLELLSNVLNVHNPAIVVQRLRHGGPQRLAVLRTLADLEWHPSLPLPSAEARQCLTSTTRPAEVSTAHRPA